MLLHHEIGLARRMACLIKKKRLLRAVMLMQDPKQITYGYGVQRLIENLIRKLSRALN